MMQRTSLAITVLIALLIGKPATADEPMQERADDPVGHYAEVNGIKMYYEIHGEGEPLVLVHGFLGSGAFWNSYIEDFAKHYKLIIPDLRCHGRSNSPTSEFTHRQAALDAYALLDLLKIERFRAMGISSGGNILLHMATQQPERVEAMVLVFATTYHPEQAREIIRQFTLDKMPEQLRKNITEWHKGGDEQMQHLLAQFQKVANRYDDMNFTPPYLSTIKAKTFVVNGDRDEFIPLCIPLELYHSIPNSYLWIIPNGKHAVPEGANKLALIEKSLEFLNGEWECNEAAR